MRLVSGERSRSLGQRMRRAFMGVLPDAQVPMFRVAFREREGFRGVNGLFNGPILADVDSLRRSGGMASLPLLILLPLDRRAFVLQRLDQRQREGVRR